MRQQSTFPIILAFVGVLAVPVRGESPLSVSFPKLAEARAHFLNEGTRLDGWSPEELLGALEIAYLTRERVPGENERSLMEDVVRRLSQLADSGGGAVSAECLLRARIVWLIARDDRASESFRDEAEWLTRNDSDNSVAWLLFAESAWLRGEFLDYSQACRRTGVCKMATTHSAGHRRRIVAALRAIGRESIDAKRELLQFPVSGGAYAMLVRHVTLLYGAPTVRSHGWEDRCEAPVLAMRYPVLCALSMPPAEAFLANELSISLAEALAKKHEEPLDRADIVALLKQQQELLYAEVVETERIARHGTAREVERAISSPETVRAKALEANPSAARALDESVWSRLLPQTPGEAAAGQPMGHDDLLDLLREGPPGEVGDPSLRGTCPECGSRVPSGASRCSECGKKLPAGNTADGK